MSEKELTEMLKKSGKTPKADFANRVMEEIVVLETKKAKVKQRLWILLVLLFMVVLLAPFVTFPDLTYRTFALSVSPLYISVVGVLFLFYEGMQLFELQRKIEQLS